MVLAADRANDQVELRPALRDRGHVDFGPALINTDQSPFRAFRVIGIQLFPAEDRTDR